MRKAIKNLFIPLMFFLIIANACRTDIATDAQQVRLLKKDGSEMRFPKAQDALDAAQPGDCVILGAGRHHGPLVFKSSGVTLKSEGNALVSAMDKSWKPQWIPAPIYGKHAWSSKIPFNPQTLAINGRVMINITEEKCKAPLPSVHKFGMGHAGRDVLKTLFTYLSGPKVVIVSFPASFPEVIKPEQYRIEASPKGSSAILISGVDNCTVEGIIMQGGEAGVRLENTKGSVVKKCLVTGADKAIMLERASENCMIIQNDLTWTPDALNINGQPASWDTWNAHKQAGTSDKWGVLARNAGSNNEVAYNYIYNVWDGIQNISDNDSAGNIETFYKENVFKGKAGTCSNGFKVHHNRIDLCLDDALEPNGELSENQWHSNIITRSECMTRFKTVTNGPFYYYNNAGWDNEDSLRFYKSSPQSAQVYIYHNFVETSRYPISYHGINLVAWDNPWLQQNLKRGTPGFHVFNNIFISEVPFRNSSSVTPDFKAAGNLYSCQPDKTLQTLGIDIESIFGKKPLFIDRKHGNWNLAADSPGRSAGKDLSSLEAKLPGCEAKYFQGALPDPGPVPGSLKKTPKGPVSGLWKYASQLFPLEERSIFDFFPEYQRWLETSANGQFEFYAVGSGEYDLIRLKLVRQAKDPSLPYNIKVYSERGELLLNTDSATERMPAPFLGKSLSTEISLDFPPQKNKRLRVVVNDAPGSKWYIPANKFFHTYLRTTVPTCLVKYDRNPYKVIYNVPAGTKSIKLNLDGLYGDDYAMVEDPAGHRTVLKASGTVNISNPGKHIIRIAFRKKLVLSIDGPSDMAELTTQQEIRRLEPKWEKPSL